MYKMIYVFLSCVLTFSFAETNKTADSIVKEKLNKNNSYSQKSFDSLIDEKIKSGQRGSNQKVKKINELSVVKSKKEIVLKSGDTAQSNIIKTTEQKPKELIEKISTNSSVLNHAEKNEKQIVSQKSLNNENIELKNSSFLQGSKVKSLVNRFAGASISRDHETLFFSEYAEGSGNHKYLEIYNPTNEAVDLSGYAYPNANNGGTDDGSYDYWNTFDDGATIAPGGVYIIAHGSSDPTILELANETHNYLSNGDDGYCLVSGGTWDDLDADGRIDSGEMTGFEVVDCVGDFGADPGSGWAVAGESNATKDHTLVRKSNVVNGNGGDWTTSAGTNTDDSEWIVYEQNTWTYLGAHTIDEEEGPYLSEDFESVATASDFPPSGWSTSTSYPWQLGPLVESSFYTTAPTSSYSGSNSAAFSNYSYSTNSVGVLTSPAIDLSNAVAPKLYFAYWDISESDYVQVKAVLSDGTSEFIYDTPTATAGWEILEVGLANFVGQIITLEFVGTSTWLYTNPHIDDVIVAEPPSYPIAELSTDNVDFGRVQVGASKSIDVGLTNAGGSDVIVSSSSSDNAKFTVSSLGTVAPGTTVSFTVTYTPTDVVADSGFIILTHNGDSSPDSIRIDGSGTLDILDEPFDADWVGTPSAPNGWSQISVSGSSPWRRSTSYGGTAYGPWASAGGEHVLITPQLDLSSSATGYSLNFRLDGSSSAGTDLKVQISSQNADATTGWTDLAYYVAGSNMPPVFEDISIDLSSYNDGNYYIAFRLLDANGYSVYLDDVRVSPRPAVPVISLSQVDVDFGEVFYQGTRTSVVTISNEGGADASASVASSNTKFVATLSSASVAAGSSVDLSIVYTPTAVGVDSGYIVLTHDAVSSPDTIEVFASASENVLYEPFDLDWVGTPSAPNGWSQISVSGSSPWRRSTSYGGTAYGPWSSAGGEHVLITPQLDLTGAPDGYNLDFRLDGSSSAGTDLKVQISSQNADATTGWTDLAYYVAGSNMPPVFEDISIDLSSYSDGNYYIAFRLLDADGYSVYLDDVTVEPRPIVPILSLGLTEFNSIPTALDSSRKVTIPYSNVGGGTDELSGTLTYSRNITGPSTFDESSESIEVVFTPIATGSFSGMVYFESNGGNDTFSVSSLVGKSVATWDDDFDGDNDSDWPIGWESVQLPQADGSFAGSGWDFYGDGGYTGDGYAYADAGGSGTVNKDFLISPVYVVESGDSVIFHAKADANSSNYPDIMTVHVSPSGDSQPDSFTVELDSVWNPGTLWQKFAYDLSTYAGDSVRVAIVYRGEYGYGLNVDDVLGPVALAPVGPIMYAYPENMDFSYPDVQTSVGKSDTLTFDYLNQGGADLEVTGLTFEGPFSISSETPLPVVTAPGGLGEFDIVFSPLVDSLYFGSMTITSNQGANIVVNLSGRGFDGVYREAFGRLGPDVDGDGYLDLTTWSAGWMFSNDGEMCPTDQPCSGAGPGYWYRTSISGQGIMYHPYYSGTDADTAISGPIVLPTLEDGYHYEIDTREYTVYGSDGDISGVAVSTDGGATFTLIGESRYDLPNGVIFPHNYDLTGYDGQTVHLALVYQATNGNSWGVLDMAIRKRLSPIVPEFSFNSDSLVFGATKVGESRDQLVFYENTGVGVFSGSVTYPASMAGPESISDLAPGDIDSMIVTYTPSTPGIEIANIIVDGSASGAEIVSIKVEANAGELAYDLEDNNPGWKQYSLAGAPFVSGASTFLDTWRRYGGNAFGHSGRVALGVYSYAPYWGGVNDFLVSPRYSISDATEILSFFTTGGDETERDSLNVWVSTAEPIMGFEISADGSIVDTGFVNTDAFTLAFQSLPSNTGWDPVSVDLSNYTTDVWVLIQSVQHYKEDGSLDGWMLKVDDLATPEVWMNSNPVLYVGKEYDFGLTQPSGDSVRYYLRNTGSQDLIIDGMDFVHGDYFDVDYLGVGDFPVTILPGGIDSIVVYWMPEMEGAQVDTLVYSSNYTVGQVDAFGRGTDRSVFIADAFNNPPNATALVGPGPGTELVIDDSNADGQTQIIWQNATDPDGYAIEYILELIVEETGDTLDTMITDNVFNLSHGEILEYMEDSELTSIDIMWDVYTYDSFETVGSSNGPWNLSIDGGWALSADNNTIPDVFALHNNYPNPFNPITNIRYDIPEVSDVKIDIYNLAGKKVKTLVSSNHQPGRYKIQWNATNEYGAPVSTGMYIYKIRAKDFVSVKKLLLMK